MTPRMTRVACLVLVGLTSPLSVAMAQTSNLTVLKQVYPVVDSTVFSFTIEGQDGVIPFSLLGEESQEFTLPPGTYTLREDVPQDWVLELARCGSFYQVGPIASGALQFRLEPGEAVVCRFFNAKPDLRLPLPPPGIAQVPTLSPTGVSVLLIALSVTGAFLLRRAL